MKIQFLSIGLVLAVLVLSGCTTIGTGNDTNSDINGFWGFGFGNGTNSDANGAIGGGTGFPFTGNGSGNGSGNGPGNGSGGGNNGSGSGGNNGLGYGGTPNLQCVICTNKAANPPFCKGCLKLYELNAQNQCVPRQCGNGATNPPQCDVCGSGQTWFTYTYRSYAQGNFKTGEGSGQYLFSEDFAEHQKNPINGPSFNEEGLIFNLGDGRDYYGECKPGPSDCANGAINSPFCDICPAGQTDEGNYPNRNCMSSCAAATEESCSISIEFNNKYLPAVNEVLKYKSKKTSFLVSSGNGKYYKASEFPSQDGFPPQGCEFEALHVPSCIPEIPASILNAYPAEMREKFHPEFVQRVGPIQEPYYYTTASPKVQACMEELRNRLSKITGQPFPST
ncbi:MAG: hypothetical protein AABW99_04185 [archaeon]